MKICSVVQKALIRGLRAVGPVRGLRAECEPSAERPRIWAFGFSRFLTIFFTELQVPVFRVNGENPDKLVHPYDVVHVYVFYCVTLFLISTPGKRTSPFSS